MVDVRLLHELQQVLDASAKVVGPMLDSQVELILTEDPPAIESPLVRLQLSEPLEGCFSLYLQEETALDLISRLMGMPVVNLLQEESRSALMEYTNVLVSSFVAELERRHMFRALPSPPVLSLVPVDSRPYACRIEAETHFGFSPASGRLCLELSSQAIEQLQACI